jgi:hypothetical protein
MTVRLITYDLNKPGQNHASVLKKIKDDYVWARLSESSYAVETNESPTTIFNAFSPLLDQNDTFFVITLTSPWEGQASKEVIQWLQQRL